MMRRSAPLYALALALPAALAPVTSSSPRVRSSPASQPPPADLFGELFARVQQARLFSDN